MRRNRDIFSGKSIYNKETRLVDKNIGLVNACNIKGQNTIWEEIEIYSQEKVYTIERLLVDKNIGLMNACNIK